jgi:beta-glucanase (GH16 family)
MAKAKPFVPRKSSGSTPQGVNFMFRQMFDMQHISTFLGILTLCWTLPLSAADSGLGAAAEVSEEDRVAASARYVAPVWVAEWSDEFEKDGHPDSTRWSYEVGRVRNNEAQFFTENRLENARVQGGNLFITARKEPWKDAEYTSASLTTLGKFALLYGKVEIRAKVPPGRGTWAALWTLADFDPRSQAGPDWPNGGEIDILEYVGMNPDRLFFTVHTGAYNHTKKNQRGNNIAFERPWDDFHRYGIVWTPERIEWFFDGELVFSYENDGTGSAAWPFDKPQYLIMNLAIGGSWGGLKGIDDSIFPAEFVIDYVRVWKQPPP